MSAVGHETRDVQASTVLRWTAGIFGLLAFTVAAMWLLLSNLEEREARLSPPASPMARYGLQEPPQPRLQIDPSGDIAELHALERAQLDSYGWVDRDAGTVHIPIARAMELLAAQRGAGSR